MGYLESLRRAAQEGILPDWQVLDTPEQLEAITALSFQKPVVIFKHSISCGISAMAKHQLERDWDFTPEELSFFYLDLINFRPASNQVADHFGVTHQSPQVILIHQGRAVYNTSHHRISVQALRQALAAIQENG